MRAFLQRVQVEAPAPSTPARVKADIADHIAQKLLVIWELSVLNIAAQEIAENTPESIRAADMTLRIASQSAFQ